MKNRSIFTAWHDPCPARSRSCTERGQTLRETGWIASHVSELGMDRADDSTILEYARQHGMACVTLDHDFHAHLAMASSGSPSVVLIRIEGLSGARQAELIQRVWKYCGDAILDGAAVSTDGTVIRVRRLPLR